MALTWSGSCHWILSRATIKLATLNDAWPLKTYQNKLSSNENTSKICAHWNMFTINRYWSSAFSITCDILLSLWQCERFINTLSYNLYKLQSTSIFFISKKTNLSISFIYFTWNVNILLNIVHLKIDFSSGENCS